MNINTVFTLNADTPGQAASGQTPTTQLVKLKQVGVGLAPPAIPADISADPIAYYILAKN